MNHDHDHAHHHAHAEPGKQTARDPVCGMTVSSDSPHRAEYDGEQYFFCCAGCRSKFLADPHKYLHAAHGHHGQHGAHGAGAPTSEPLPAGTIYTCPMHPEIQQDHPGSCPKCGMALEPLMPSLE